MKAYRLLSTIICVFLFTGTLVSALNSAKPLLVVLLMIKDEAEVIAPTLETYLTQNIKNGFQDTENVAYVIYDTGSTDGTQEKARDFFKQHNIKNFVIEEEPFVDFSRSRNRGLEIAKKHYPATPFVLFSDAEWYLNDFDKLLNYCKEHVQDGIRYGCYNMQIIDNRPYSFCTARLMRQESNVRFVGRVHEIPNATPAATLPSDIFFRYDPKKFGSEKTQKRWARDKEWLLLDHKENPKDRRTIYLLGQTCTCLQEWENACNYYRMVTEFEQKDEFTYLAYYNLGEIIEFINTIENKTSDEDWLEPFQHYLKAYSLRPHRAEPLVKIARHYCNTNEMHLSYLFARKAAKMNFPHQDTLFIEKGMYDVDRHRILGICAWHVGDFKNGEKSIKTALQVCPGDKGLEHDLACYQRKKSH